VRLIRDTEVSSNRRGAEARGMKTIAYLLHRFPRITDTFIMREVRALQKRGTDIQIISIWNPTPRETDAKVMDEWANKTTFLLPQSIFSITRVLCWSIIRSPIRFISAVHLAFATAQPGSKGLIKQAFYLAEAMLAAEALKRRRITHVHNHFGDHSGIVTMLAARFCNIPYSISFHGPHVFFDGTLARIKEKVAHAQFVRCISYFCRSQVILFSGCTNLSPLKIIHCGLDLRDYQFRLPKEKVERLYCAARLAPEKGFEFLIQAVKILIDRRCDIQLRLVGDGPGRDALEDMARDLGILDRVHLLGPLDEAAKMRELHAADLFVLPSLAEGLPSSITEAMAVGVPVIATNIAGTSELVEQEKTGLLVRPADPQALANAVIAMIDNYDFRKRAAELGRQKVMEEFDVDKETAELQKYLEQSC
jgi:colanic acid/amylovoran biosynthesis glycosyltransferase